MLESRHHSSPDKNPRRHGETPVSSQVEAFTTLDLSRRIAWELRSPAISDRVVCDLGSRKIEAVILSREPRIILLKNFLSNREIRHLRLKGWMRGLHPSEVDSPITAASVSSGRTSSSCTFKRGESPVIRSIESRIEVFTGFPPEHLEPLELVRYKPGEFFAPHYDSPAPGTALDRNLQATQGRRLFTFMIYLNDLKPGDSGGTTNFVELPGGLKVRPKRGAALMWDNYSIEGQFNWTTRHEGVAPERSTKYIVNTWVRELPSLGKM